MSAFDQLRETSLDDIEIDEDEIDVTDLRERFEVQLDSGYDTFVVVDGLPEVTDDQKPKLVKFLAKKLSVAGKVRDDSVHMPMGDDGKSLRFAFVEFATAAEAAAAIRQLDATPLDKKHTIRLNKLTDIEKFGREGRVHEEFVAPAIEEFHQRDHLWSFLEDPTGRGRDQFAMFREDRVGVFWNNEKHNPEAIVDRNNWTELFVQWSPLGTYLTSIHKPGVQIWGGQSWSRIRRFPHPFAELVSFSPHEKYVVTWSSRPITVPADGSSPLSLDDDGKNYVVWDVATGKPLRSFANLDVPAASDTTSVGGKQGGGAPRGKPTSMPFKWSADDSFVARLNPGQSISVYELPGMGLLGKTSVKIEGIVDFEWAPATVPREGVKKREQLLCYWTPEIGSNPAKVGLMSLPDREVIRTLNLFHVSDVKLHWQSEGALLCVKVDRHSKSKKSQATTLEIFRVKEKGVPVEVVDTIKETVVNFAWEPKGERFIIIAAMEAPAGPGVPPKTLVSFFGPDRSGKSSATQANSFHLIRTLERGNSNAIYWSPKGRFVVVATVHNPQSCELQFFDMEHVEAEKNANSKLKPMNEGDHYGVTDVTWDPSGRYVTSYSSAWKHQLDHGYHLYDFKGELLREESITKFKQWSWRPRPPTLLTKEEQKLIRKNLREYSVLFEQEDADRGASADQAVVDARRQQLQAWYAWRQQVEKSVAEEREAAGLPADPIADVLAAKTAALNVEEQVIEEVVEEVLEENEEIIG